MKWIQSILRRLLRWSGDTSLDAAPHCWACEHCALEELAALREDPEEPSSPRTLPGEATIDDLFKASGLSVTGPDYSPIPGRPRGIYLDPICEGGEIALETVGSLADDRSLRLAQVWWRKS